MRAVTLNYLSTSSGTDQSDDEEYKLYEKIYLAEIDRKEKLISRLNLPLALIVALLSFLSYLLFGGEGGGGGTRRGRSSSLLMFLIGGGGGGGGFRSDIKCS